LSSASTKTVLIVDDDEDLRLVFGRTLARNGYEIVTAADGPTALTKAGTVRPDIVILDVMMPGMSGVTACAHLRRALGPSVPIIFLTARDDRETLEKGFAAGGDDYLIKPVSQSQLIERLPKLLELSEMEVLEDRRVAILKKLRGR